MDTGTLDTYQPDSQVDNFDVKTADTTIQDLQGSVDSITQELYALDAKERTGDTISDRYRAIRGEIVNVIQTINSTTTTVSETLNKIAAYQKLIFLAYQDLTSSRDGFTDTKEYIKDFADFIYKLDNKIYTDDGTSIDDVKLIVNSDNIPRTLANDYMVQSMLLQFNDLMDNFTTNETKQLDLIKKLNQLKIQAEASIQNYQADLDKLQQKKNYLLQFISLYKDDKVTQEAGLNSLFDSTKSVYDKVTQLVSDAKK